MFLSHQNVILCRDVWCFFTSCRLVFLSFYDVLCFCRIVTSCVSFPSRSLVFLSHQHVLCYFHIMTPCVSFVLGRHVLLFYRSVRCFYHSVTSCVSFALWCLMFLGSVRLAFLLHHNVLCFFTSRSLVFLSIWLIIWLPFPSIVLWPRDVCHPL